jgi:hypothetical protein
MTTNGQYQLAQVAIISFNLNRQTNAQQQISKAGVGT